MNTKKLIVFIIYYLESIKIKTRGYHMSSSLLKIISSQFSNRTRYELRYFVI